MKVRNGTHEVIMEGKIYGEPGKGIFLELELIHRKMADSKSEKYSNESGSYPDHIDIEYFY